MSKNENNSDDNGEANFEGDDPDHNYLMTQVVSESEYHLSEKLSQDTYCSMNSQMSNTENLDTEDDIRTIETTTSRGVSSETAMDTEESSKSSKQITPVEEVEMVDKTSDNNMDVSATVQESNSNKKDNSVVMSYNLDKEKSNSVIEEDQNVKNTPSGSNTIPTGVTSSPELFSEAVYHPEPMEDISSIEISKNSSILTITDTSRETPDLESSTGKRKAEGRNEDETPTKKSRPSIMITYEGTPQRNYPVPIVNLTEVQTPEEIMILDETQNDFSLRLESQIEVSPEDEKHESEELTKTWKSNSTEPVENSKTSEQNSPGPSHTDKESDLSWHSHKEDSKKDLAALKEKYETKIAELEDKLLEKNKQTTVDSNDVSPAMTKESLYTFTEKCFMCGLVKFTINEATNHITSAEVQQLSLVAPPGKNKKESSSLSPGTLADRSFSSGTSGGSCMSLLGPFTLPTNTRYSILSTSTTSGSSASGSRNFNGPFKIPTSPILKNLKNTMCQPLSGFGHTFPAVENLEEFLYLNNLVNGSPDGHRSTFQEKISKCETTVPKNKNIKTNSIEETVVEEKDENDEEVGKEEKTSMEVAKIGLRKNKGRSKQSKSLTPAKRKVSTPAKVVKKPVTESFSEEEELVKPEGNPVFAKWSDSQYYPGWVNEVVQVGQTSRVKVHFCDGNVNILSTVKVIPASWLKAGRVALGQRRDKLEYSPCIILNVEPGENGPVYTVDGGESSTSKLNFSQIALTEAHAIEIREEAIATGHMSSNSIVSLDNVLNHPRTRTPRTPQNIATTSRSSSKNKSKEAEPSNRTGKKRSASVSSESSSLSMTTESIRGNEGIALDPECSPQEFPENSKRKTSHRAQIKSTSKKSKKALEEEFEMMEKNYGPLPEEGSKIFSGFNFLITYTAQKCYTSKQNNDMNGSSEIEQSSDGEGFNMKLFNKQRLRAQIEKGGGKLYQKFQQVPQNEYKRTCLITDAPSCTPLYLQCLVNGISIYSHRLIMLCCQMNISFEKMIKNTTDLLPAGWSLERKEYRKQQKSIKPFEKLDKGILLALNQNKASLQFWKKLLEAAGVTVYVHSDRVKNLDQVSAIVTDFGCSEELLNLAKISETPVQSLVWVEQCIIEGVQMTFDGHPEYKPDYITDPGSPEY